MKERKPPVTAAALPDGWTEIVRTIVARDGYAVRGPESRPVIEVKSLTTNVWNLLALPGGGTTFVSGEDRDIVLAKIQGT